jgi:hypothetical protein
MMGFRDVGEIHIEGQAATDSLSFARQNDADP